MATFIESGDTFTASVKTSTSTRRPTLRRPRRPATRPPTIASSRAPWSPAWKKISGKGRDYLSGKLDDPSFPGPIYATLIEGEDAGSFGLIWSRRNGE